MGDAKPALGREYIWEDGDIRGEVGFDGFYGLLRSERGRGAYSGVAWLSGHWIWFLSSKLHPLITVFAVRIIGWELGVIGKHVAVVYGNGMRTHWVGKGPEGKQIIQTAARAEKFKISQETCMRL